MTCFICIRHGETDATDQVLSGRSEGVSLNATGRAQAEALPERLQNFKLDLICTSELDRTLETACPLARAHSLQPRTLPALLELDYGDWQNAQVSKLEGDNRWTRYNRWRSLQRIPEGELLVEAQLRMVHAMELARKEVPKGTVAFVGHGDPLRALFAYLLGIPLDFIHRLRLDPASVSVVSWDGFDPIVHCLNNTGSVVELS